MEYHDLTTEFLSRFDDYDHHECLRRIEDTQTGLVAYIGVHNTNLGPALGGCRMYPYQSEDDAILDVLRLSKGMTYKNALAGLPLGGGKSVIIGDPRSLKTDELMAAMGRAVQTFEGLYITAEDSGTNEHDMMAMAQETRFVVGQEAKAGSDLGGDPSPRTAYGVFCGLKASVAERYGSDDMSGKIVAVQGLGSVGFDLCRQLDAEEAHLIVCDINQEALDKAVATFKNVTVVAPEDIFGVEADILAPCAMGAQINETTIAQLKVDIIAGAANNQLATHEDEQRLMDKNILYAPDYVLNAAGVIAVSYEYQESIGQNSFPHDLTRANMMAHIEQIGATLRRIYKIAKERNISSARAADELAEAIFKGDAAPSVETSVSVASS